jgi:hypothetical protein
MPSSPPPPAPPLSVSALPFVIDNDDSLVHTGSDLYESRHVWTPQNNYIHDVHQFHPPADDYTFFYALNYDATKL